MAQIILQLIIGGLAMGFIYALVSIEYTIIWNASGLLNFSHERLILMGAYLFGAQFVMRNHLSNPMAIVLMLVTLKELTPGVFCNRDHYVRANHYRRCPYYLGEQPNSFSRLATRNL